MPDSGARKLSGKLETVLPGSFDISQFTGARLTGMEMSWSKDKRSVDVTIPTGGQLPAFSVTPGVRGQSGIPGSVGATGRLGLPNAAASCSGVNTTGRVGHLPDADVLEKTRQMHVKTGDRAHLATELIIELAGMWSDDKKMKDAMLNAKHHLDKLANSTRSLNSVAEDALAGQQTLIETVYDMLTAEEKQMLSMVLNENEEMSFRDAVTLARNLARDEPSVG